MERRTDFLTFACAVLSARAEVPARHHRLLIDHLQKVADGTTDRLMVLMPPGAAKSTYGSVLFPAFWFTAHPVSDVIMACHTASLAEHFGRTTRKVITEHGKPYGLALSGDGRAAGRLALQGGGNYFAAGVRGPITGRRADLVVIDDPIKSWAEADSRVARDALDQWYRAELISRLKPRGRIVLILTRWHADDLAGRLMAGTENWTVLRLPALAEADDALGRAEGDALWPEWEDRVALQRRRAAVGERAFAALYQQAPQSASQKLFSVDAAVVLDAPPPLVAQIRGWDLAATPDGGRGDPDWTAGVKVGMTAGGDFVVLDVVRVRAGPADVERVLLNTARQDGAATQISLPQDPGQAGIWQVQSLTRALAGFPVISSPETGAKFTRAQPAAAALQSGRLRVLRAAWTDQFLAELRAFPDGDKDDQVDALARALAGVSVTPTPTRRVNLQMMGR
ncbi:MAG TPA: phage terminase large subunit [Acidiphilium sp.]|nr:MAG: hypothetical protein B7Z67_05320 [Acidiphilium sp. 21-60-14]OYV92543.1 MAG: hypothetical protein B7Z57_00485 [Acidiphilium sp. 37-60-79]OZB40994.1 MAG: hypothetical protein B7X48_02810 [Acidiphilium sp. 34-60-192]HQT87975.1 phage terminase large subunit [Acidiphilium sp.]HQU22747.1 phage terminase large subunit [Acidiphilium sp.]